jgi:hypothetical protein
MKKLKISLLALSVLAGGSLVASAAAATTYTAYNLFAAWTNITVWDVDGAITTSGTTFPQVDNDTFVSTDGSGKITGGGFLTVDYNTNNVPWSRIFVDISGKVSSTKSSAASVSLTMKGNGFTVQDHTVAATATPVSCNLKFTGAPGPNPDTNSSQTSIIVGTVSGTITGNTPLGTKTAKVTNLPVVLQSGSFTLQASMDVLASATKMSIWGLGNSTFTGTGNIKKDNTFTANLKGTGNGKGSSLSLTGTIGTYTNGFAGTNSGISYSAPVQPINIKSGKIQGQTVSGASTSVSANLYH